MKFHILSGSTAGSTKTAALFDPIHNGGIRTVGGGDFAPPVTMSMGNPSCHFNQESERRSTPNKKRSRRRRKGNSRSKVEPLSPYKKGGIVPTLDKSNSSKKQHDAPMTKRDIYFALDCEMVGVGPDGMTSAVSRVTIVNWENQIVLDTYVRVPTPVTDYRTQVSGITPEHLQPRPGHALMTFAEVREKVQSILRGKILIGHGLENDLKALGLYHPWTDIRDTATYNFYMREFRDPVTQYLSLTPKKLRDLAWEKLGRQIQIPGVPHNPLEDAIAALDLYKEARGQWEDHLILMAQQKDEEHSRQLMEQRRQHEHAQQHKRLQHEQQEMQIRRLHWLAGIAPTQPMYLGHPPQRQQYLQQTIVRSDADWLSCRFSTEALSGILMIQGPPSLAAPSCSQGPTSRPPQPPMRLPSSWFGFTLRPKQQQQPSRISPAASQDSFPTLTTVQSSSSQDFSSPPGDREEDPEDSTCGGRIAMETSQERILAEATAPTNNEAENSKATMKVAEDADLVLSITESVTEVPAMESTFPTDYEPPRYFTNPDPEPMSSSSWFKLGWGSRKDKDSSTKGEGSGSEMVEGLERPRRGSFSGTQATSPSSYSLFSGRLFPRRNSESCVTNICEKEMDGHSRSLH